MRIPRTRKQAGDTIVEVLICIGIVGVVITGAFVVAGKSTATVQDSNERSKAELHLQTQVELLKQYLGAPGATAPNISLAKSCMENNVVQASECTIADGGATFKVSFSPLAAGSNTYRFEIKWDNVSGGTSQMSYVYSVYPVGS